MPAHYGVLNQSARQEQKRLSRERDADALRSGAVSARELSRSNGFFSGLDLNDFRISGIGKSNGVGVPYRR